jgi:hypothetical protein
VLIRAYRTEHLDDVYAYTGVDDQEGGDVQEAADAEEEPQTSDEGLSEQ